ncbi:hypothetical protein bcere0002_16910 [Bacillus cereus ATCC 10876]|nr:hypothetical protein HD73_2058 [Bacillus thuringiensis serovar kurstaki str. HD73]AIM32617.1 hypothetical protein DF16_orf04202 [Bacillus thuringiensis serovar kurstaki str. YBT-1520]EDZ51436.1 hypothetical protein BCAH1134_1879 [Bacillus cereus AH1134]EEK51320.1 hypothetical protein bcere0002_16910 [Bacillus cereus ATCC 10876]EEK62653.1 hypothetical protein bcere0005_16850 [Bacillus cereus 172560W]EEL65490.1 hypothetical protein bcere0025_16700 [Bacillus cereus F65185]EEM48362.1 hypotheti
MILQVSSFLNPFYKVLTKSKWKKANIFIFQLLCYNLIPVIING